MAAVAAAAAHAAADAHAQVRGKSAQCRAQVAGLCAMPMSNFKTERSFASNRNLRRQRPAASPRFNTAIMRGRDPSYKSYQRSKPLAAWRASWKAARKRARLDRKRTVAKLHAELGARAKADVLAKRTRHEALEAKRAKQRASLVDTPRVSNADCVEGLTGDQARVQLQLRVHLNNAAISMKGNAEELRERLREVIALETAGQQLPQKQTRSKKRKRGVLPDGPAPKQARLDSGAAQPQEATSVIDCDCGEKGSYLDNDEQYWDDQGLVVQCDECGCYEHRDCVQRRRAATWKEGCWLQCHRCDDSPYQPEPTAKQAKTAAPNSKKAATKKGKKATKPRAPL